MTPLSLATLPPSTRRFVGAALEKKRSLLVFVLLVTVAAIVVSLLLPNWYQARTTVLPPSEVNDSFGIMTGLIQSAALSRVGLMTTSTVSDVYSEILKSRTLKERLIQEFGLGRVYKRKGMERTLEELDLHLKVGITNSGLIAVAVEDRDPKRAAAMANRLVDELDRFNRETLNTRAKRTREFLEARISEVQARMNVADAALTSYERRCGVVADASVGGMASIIAQKMNLQVKREYVSSYTSPGSAAVRSIDAEIAAYGRELGRLPGLKNEGSRLALEAEIQRRVFTMLTGQYEDARVQETRDTPTITVLDRATAPELKSRPKRGVIVLASVLAALLLSSGWVGLSLWKAGPA